LTRAVPVWVTDPLVPGAVSTAISSRSLLIQSKGGAKCVKSAASANRLQLPFGCTTPRIGEHIRLVEKFA
jgi:hypothetical protein